ncbi:ProQ/FINO family protein, partial [Psittacicella gerlachiana]
MSEEKKSFTPRANVSRRTSTTTIVGRRTQGNNNSGRPNSRQQSQFNRGPNRGPAKGGKPGFGRKPAPRRKVLTEQEKRVLEDKRLKRERLEQTYQELHARFPNAFNRENVKPLSVDVHKNLFEIATAEGPLRKSALRQFLASYIRNDEYHNAALRLKKRFNLDGEPVAELSESELDYHRQNLRPKARPRKPAFNKKPGFGGKKPGFG